MSLPTYVESRDVDAGEISRDGIGIGAESLQLYPYRKRNSVDMWCPLYAVLSYKVCESCS